jgi:hypothetical protein
MSTTQDITGADELTALGARRRYEALVAAGYPATEIAEELDLIPDQLDEVPPHKWRDLAALFDRWQLTPGPSEEARELARERGWAPPLAWDEDTIDAETVLVVTDTLDGELALMPVEVEPQGVAPPPRRTRTVPPDFPDIVAEHRELGHYDEQIAESLGLSLDALSRRLHRAGLGERRHGTGEWIGRPPQYGNRYRLRLAASADRLQGLTGVARAAL